MDNIYLGMIMCAHVAKSRVYPYLLAKLGNQFIIDPPTAGLWCFRITLPTGAPISRISVSVPPDAYGNRPQDFDNGEDYIPHTYETALIDGEEEIVYIESLGYDDIRRSYTLDELVSEIQRVAHATTTAVITTS